MRLALAASLCAMACSDAMAATACAEGGLRVADHASVAFEGDSLTYGFDPTPTGGTAPINGTSLKRSKLPFPEEVGRKLDGHVVVVNRGFPGDRSQDGLTRWKSAKTTTVTVVMFGTNDFGNFGKLPGGTASPDLFSANLEKLIARRRGDGGRVILATPPPLQNPESDQRLEPYRRVVRDLAKRDELVLIDTPQVLDGVEDKWVDGLHLSTAANDALAQAVASALCVTAE